ncbi:MAG: sensor histidine kinase [Alphaproteobacteria bacterium]|nr:sensor histidine kinase [Alphaproteobacteria bacterium SS10]
MGFFQSFGLDYGRETDNVSGNSNFIPVKCGDKRQIIETARSLKIHPGLLVDQHANHMSSVLSRGQNDLNEFISYSIREIIRNALEHSESDKYYYCGQYWPTKKRVELSIGDEGIGIFNSLKKNPENNLKNDTHAISTALGVGVSGNPKAGQSKDKMWGNTGFGLYVISEVARDFGSLLICSGSGSIGILGKSTKQKDCFIPGTILRLIIDTEKINNTDKIVDEYVERGEKKSDQGRLASGATKMARI